MYSNLGQSDRANEYITKAFNLRDRASEREKLHITSYYYTLVTGELDKAAETYREWEENYPKDYVAPTNIGFVSGLRAGRSLFGGGPGQCGGSGVSKAD
jgi:tetratricopeptide (TPR) repeat protein